MAKGFKTGGRSSGTPNESKKTLLELIELKHKDYNPVLALSDIATDADVDLRLRIYCHKEVAKYTHAPLKATESNEKNSHTTVTFTRDKDTLRVPQIIISQCCDTCSCDKCKAERIKLNKS